MVLVHCRGCGQLVGYAPRDYVIYCTEYCYKEYPVSTTEARDALIEAMFYLGRYKTKILGTLFGITRQRVDQIIKGRTYT